MVLRFDFERAAVSLIAGISVILVAGVALQMLGYPNAMETAKVVVGGLSAVAVVIAVVILMTPWFEDIGA